MQKNENDTYNYEHPEHDEFIDATLEDSHTAAAAGDGSAAVDQQAFVEQDSNIMHKVSSFFGSLQTNKKNRIIVVAAAVVVVVVLALIFGSSSHKNNNASIVEPLSTQAASNSSDQMLEQKVHIASVEADNRLDSAAHSIQENKQSVTRLDGQLDALKSAMGTLSQNQQNLQVVIEKLSSQLVEMKKTAEAKVEKATPVKKAKPVTYTLRASIPGRAWIVGSNGVTKTVKMGDSLANYGKVEKIDSEQGQIVTSSGKTIQLNAND